MIAIKFVYLRLENIKTNDGNEAKYKRSSCAKPEEAS